MGNFGCRPVAGFFSCHIGNRLGVAMNQAELNKKIDEIIDRLVQVSNIMPEYAHSAQGELDKVSEEYLKKYPQSRDRYKISLAQAYIDYHTRTVDMAIFSAHEAQKIKGETIPGAKTIIEKSINLIRQTGANPALKYTEKDLRNIVLYVSGFFIVFLIAIITAL